MVDYKKKYLKYKKKYLAIKKLKGGGWMLEKGAKYLTNKAEEFATSVPSWSELRNTGSQAMVTGTKYLTEGYAPMEKASRYSAKFKGKTFNIFKSDKPTQFDSRMSKCENSLEHDTLAKLGGEHDLDRFVLIKNETMKNLLPRDYTARPGEAQIIKYTNGKDANSEENIYSDHEAICMPLYTGILGNYKKLITMNLEGFCWGNGEYPENIEWGDHNQKRLDNVIELLRPYISPGGDGDGNIFLFQEVVLKDAANIERQEKKSLNYFENALINLNPNYVLIDDGCTGAILYDRITWNLEQIINIDRRFLDYNGNLKGPEEVVKKKSNGYILQNIEQPKHKIGVVNIHLKALMSGKDWGEGVKEADLDLLSKDEAQRLYEMANIYNIMKNVSKNYKIPIYFGGDWNSHWGGGELGRLSFPCYTDVTYFEDIEKNREKFEKSYLEEAQIPNILSFPPAYLLGEHQKYTFPIKFFTVPAEAEAAPPAQVEEEEEELFVSAEAEPDLEPSEKTSPPSAETVQNLLLVDINENHFKK